MGNFIFDYFILTLEKQVIKYKKQVHLSYTGYINGL